jgi:hypothetical protein
VPPEGALPVVRVALRGPIASATLGDVTTRTIVMLGLLLPALVTPVAAQGPPVGRLPIALDEARGLTTQPFSTLPVLARPAERYVPPQRVYSPAQGRDVLVPGHYERAVNGQRVEVPPLVTTTPDGRNPTVVPGGERGPLESRDTP